MDTWKNGKGGQTPDGHNGGILSMKIIESAAWLFQATKGLLRIWFISSARHGKAHNQRNNPYSFRSESEGAGDRRELGGLGVVVMTCDGDGGGGGGGGKADATKHATARWPIKWPSEKRPSSPGQSKARPRAPGVDGSQPQPICHFREHKDMASIVPVWIL